MKRALAIVLVLTACKRTPPPGSGAIETTHVKTGGSAEPGRAHTLATFPGGEVLVVDAPSCTISRFDDKSKAAQWFAVLPCDGVLEATVAPDSMTYARTLSSLAAISPDGKERWRVALESVPVARQLLVPATTRDSLVIIAGAPRALTAFKSDGTTVWRFAVSDDETLISAPLGSRGEGVFALTNRALYHIASDGTLRYRKPQPQ
jgi:hypothetical protein